VDLDLQIVVAGLLVGFVVGLTGMGGGALMTPVLVLFFNVAPLAAVSSDLVAAAVMKPVGSFVHMRRGTIHWGLVGWLMVGSVPSAFAGVLVLKALGNGERVPQVVVCTGRPGATESRRVLARRLGATGITANALHPGGVDTGIFRKGGGLRGLLGSLWARGFGRTPEQGADTAVWLAASADVDGTSGRFYQDRTERPCRLRNLETEERLFALCESYFARSPARETA